ncbi:histidine phosphatase family protein [Aliihoeflea aestuarii]|jgi:phosphohistidine phosphatase|uniref:SixA phosphatase family protein n=1 Tax=Aliihoeflea aestuarii TaxID=453840 RepID=UPI002093818B|nr:histidine phosphatase family protein [Aliihoeflea aestuarii]MCO6390640.1 histidine phosphatase family protein [Aliihoeflea aestuarii]
MPRLYLLRHAKAGWACPGQRDFDRPLEGIGIDDATRLGSELRSRKSLPGKVVSSSSVRTRQTVEALTLGNLTVEYLDALYEATPVQTLEIIQAQKTDSDLMIVGHNPVMEDLATALVKNAGSHPELQGGFPTCGLAIIAFEEPLERIEPGSGTLELFLRPSDTK